MSSNRNDSENETRTLELGTNEEGTFSEVLGGVFTEFFGTYSENVRFHPVLTEGYVDNLRLLDSMELDVAFSHSETIQFAYNEMYQFEDRGLDRQPVLGLPVMQNINHHFIHREDSDISEVSDLEDRTISVGYSPTFQLISEAFLDAEGVLDEVDIVQMKLNEQADALFEGEIDAAIGAIINHSPNPASRRIWESGEVAVTRLSAAGLEQLQSEHPWFGRSTLAADDPRLDDAVGLETDLTLPKLESLTVVREDLDADLLFHTMKTLHENQQELAEIEESLRGFGFGTYTDAGTEFDRWGMGELAASEIPFHPGTADYLREVGEWDSSWTVA